MDFGQKLKMWIIEKFGTVSNGAEAFGTDQASMSRYITGGRFPGFEFFKKLAKYDAPIYWLLLEEEELKKGKYSNLNIMQRQLENFENENKALHEKIIQMEEVVKKAESAMRLKNDLLKFMNKKEE